MLLRKVIIGAINRNRDNMSTAGKKRSIVKTFSWRIIATTDTFLIAWFLTGDFKIGLGIAGIEVVTKMVLYYLHERGWASLDWGMEEDEIPEGNDEN